MPRKRKGPGRPPLEVTREVTKRLRMTKEQKAAQEAAAIAAGLTWSAWALKAIDAALE